MVRKRVPETSDGIQSDDIVRSFDLFQRRMRDKKFLETDAIIKAGIDFGYGLEIGPGPGYLGLEWLLKTQGSKLTGLEISPEMIKTARKNADEYGLSDRVSYKEGSALEMPFGDDSFDFVFSNGSLHEWEKPEKVFSEINRVLKPKGLFFISDLKRNLSYFVFLFMKMSVKPKEIRPGLITSVNAAYTADEITDIINRTEFFGHFSVSENPFGLNIAGRKKSL